MSSSRAERFSLNTKGVGKQLNPSCISSLSSDFSTLQEQGLARCVQVASSGCFAVQHMCWLQGESGQNFSSSCKNL